MTGPASIRCFPFNPPRRKCRTEAGRWDRRLGFTLVELLVVVGILAVLAGLILSALSRGRGKAASINCLSNVRQSGQLLSAFVLDNNAYPFEGKSGVDELGDMQSGDWAVSLYQKQYPTIGQHQRLLARCPPLSLRKDPSGQLSTAPDLLRIWLQCAGSLAKGIWGPLRPGKDEERKEHGAGEGESGRQSGQYDGHW